MEDPDQARLEQLLTCPVCHDIFKDPLQLPCGHSMCTSCLENLVVHLSETPFRCPDCRASFGETFDAPKSYTLANIAEEFKLHKNRREILAKCVYCDFCPLRDNLALKTCLKCEVSMCKQHMKEHTRLPVFTGHPLVEPISDLLERKCPQHNDQVLRYYCKSSRRYICILCSLENKHLGRATELSNVLWRQLTDNMEQHFRMVGEQVTNSFNAVKELQSGFRRKNASPSHSNGVPIILLFLWFIVLYYAYNYSSENQSLRESLEKHLANSHNIFSRNVEPIVDPLKSCKPPIKDENRKRDAERLMPR